MWNAVWGHSKSTFVEEGRGVGHWKANKNEQGEWGAHEPDSHAGNHIDNYTGPLKYF